MSIQQGSKLLTINLRKLEHPLVSRVKFDIGDSSPPMAVGDKFQPSHGKIMKLEKEKKLSFKEFSEFMIAQREITVSKN
ncbi:unnamed protein product [Blepharisma stoltei]|uniref:Uncharacterized protein n=1 Tax=Blepharisma stoltei TaxID=1481888 RepID=A0AAU9J7S9_9CILI|nr:unnamed protein product [Blepharisma stoltei]